MSRITFFALLIFAVIPARSQHKVQHCFVLAENPAIVEGMSYDPVGKHFYFGESVSKRMLRYTLSGKPAGHIDCAKDGMTSVLGSTVDERNHHLWIAGATDTGENKRMCVFQYDLKDGVLIKKYPDTSGKAKLFNDVTVTTSGSVFVTDTYAKVIYKANTETAVMYEFLQDNLIKDANGITSHNDTLYVSTSRGIVRIDVAGKQITSLPLRDFMIAGIDGLYYYRGSLIGIQNVFYPVTIIRYYINNIGNTLFKAELLAAGHSSFSIPTTGAVAGDYFYFMSNNNIGKEDRLKSGGMMEPITIEKISLKD